MARNDEPVLPMHTRTLRQPTENSAQSNDLSKQRTHMRRPHLRGHHPRRKANLSKVGVPNFYRNEAIAFIAELSGTFMFLFFAFVGTQVANQAAEATTGNAENANNTLSQAPNATTLQYIALSFGFSLTINVWIFFRISGGLFNPVVTLALYLIGAIKGIRGISCFFAQIIGAIAASAVASAILPGSLNIATSLGPNVSIARGCFLEMFLTCELVLAILFLAAEKHKATFLAPIGIGLALFIAEMAGVFYTGGSLNPARSFGPAVVIGSWEGYHWIYWVGPLLGSLLAVGFYKLMKFSDYETVNPGQDFNDEEIEHFKPPEDAETADDVKRPNPSALAAEQAIQQATQANMQDAFTQATEEVARSMSPQVERSRGRTGTRLSREKETGSAYGDGMEEEEDNGRYDVASDNNRYSQARVTTSSAYGDGMQEKEEEELYNRYSQATTLGAADVEKTAGL